MSRGAVRPAVCRAGPGSGALPLCRSKSSLPSESCRGVFAARRGVGWGGVEGARGTSEGAARRRPRPRSTFRIGSLLVGPARKQPWGGQPGIPGLRREAVQGAYGADLTAVFTSAHHPPSALPVCRQSPSLSVRQLCLLVQALVTLKVRPLPLSDQIQCVVFWFATCRERISAWTQN